MRSAEGPPAAGRPSPGSRDPGLSTERTALAWERTGLSLAAIAVLLATAALHHAAGLAVLPASAALLAAALAVRSVGRRAYAANKDGATKHPPPQRQVRQLALCTETSALIAAVVVILPLR